ncbi:MAG: peptide chain release factor N(5)-glutamine methyltransferase [Oscillospiraceae bacterium]|nr:peptide chain release factor N(5)-glutamine methyltransferase [Oscillospiraceae bacterium]
MADYSYHDLYMAAKQALRKVDGENAEFTAREIVAAATDRTVSQLVADFQLTIFQRDIKRVNEMVERHLKGEPLAYILGQWEFYGLSLTVTPDVLIPRDDTEAVCDLAIHQVKLGVQNPRVLDLCTGTGCIGLAIASKVKDARVTLGEISPEALRIAKKNTQDNHLSGRVSCISLDVRQPAPKYLGKYDLIVSNPPYITARQMEALDTSVRDYEPRLALYGGEDGLDFYRAIVKNYTPILRDGGFICFEFGMGQEAEVCQILMEHGYQLGRLARDSGERARAVLAQKPIIEDTGKECAEDGEE